MQANLVGRFSVIVGSLLFLASCGSGASEAANNLEAEHAVAARKADQAAKKIELDRKNAEKLKACTDSLGVAEGLLGNGQSLMSAIESSHASDIAEKERALEESRPLFQNGGAGLALQFSREDALREARIAMLREQEKLTGALIPLEKLLNEIHQRSRVQVAAGKGAADTSTCEDASQALSAAKDSLLKAKRGSSSISKRLDDELEVVKAASDRVGK